MSDGVRQRNTGAPQPIQSKKPDNSAFKQQRLPAWQPVLTAKSVLPIFFIVGVVFIPIGSLIIVASEGVQEVERVYTSCKAKFEFTNQNMSDIQPVNDDRECKDIYDTWKLKLGSQGGFISDPPTCVCVEEINITAVMEKPIFAYYRLTNYYQNHRRYVKSRDDTQLLAQEGSISEFPDGDCSPYDKISDGNGGHIPIAPCGAIANSLFNDTFFIRRCATDPCAPITEDEVKDPNIYINTVNGKIAMNGVDIAWKTDKSQKFDPNENTGNETFMAETSRPFNWRSDVHTLGTDSDALSYRAKSGTSGKGFRNEDFIVWMRTAAFPTFRKLYRRIDEDLPEGTYQILTYYNYPVHSFGGGKFFVLATTSWIGGKNLFLGWTYAIVGAICLIVMFILLCISRRKNNRD